MSFYRARPVEVEAYQWTGQLADLPAGWRSTGHFTLDPSGDLIVQTPQGPSRAHRNDWVIRGLAGEFYPVAPATFLSRWEPAS